MRADVAKMRLGKKLGIALFGFLPLFLTACENLPAADLYSGAVNAQENYILPAPPKQVSFAFDPIEGIPVNVTDNILRILVQFGPSYGINVKYRNAEDVTFRVRGFINATGESSLGAISYVYKIYDNSGALIHRIEGINYVGLGTPDPFFSTLDDSDSGIATMTLEAFKVWLYSLDYKRS